MAHEIRVSRPEPPLRDHLAMGDDRVSVTSRWIEVNGRPTIPISAEIHYSRIPSEEWDAVLDGAKAGGVTHVATYVIWNHHEAHRGAARFDGDLDLGRFLRAARQHGLEIVLRIGPFAHAEARHGGLPDWLVAEQLVPRSDDPAYLAAAADWFSKIAEQVAGIPLFAVQVENELYDDPGHLLTLKSLARDAGFDPPIWTATGWGGANLPPRELLPTFAGYAAAFWTDADAGFDASSASNFYLTDERDETGVGADSRDSALSPSTLDLSRYPYATCELGGGMISAYHRRPVVSAHDVEALALAKLGSGSVWQGYYMYADGRNPGRGLQESHVTGGRNDFPEIAYDFGAPLTVDGARRPAWARLRLQHHFLHAFGQMLARMPATFPDAPPVVPDTKRLRHSVRSDGERGFLFVVNHQPGVDLPAHPGVEWVIRLPDLDLRLPAVDIPSHRSFVWPLRLAVGEAELRWATAQPMTLVPWRGLPLLVLMAVPGIEVQQDWGDARLNRLPIEGPGEWFEVADSTKVIAHVLVLQEADALDLEIADTLVLGRQRPLSLGPEGWLPGMRSNLPHPVPVTVATVRPSTGAPTPIAGGPVGRASIPVDWSTAAEFALSWETSERGTLVIEWEGDVARAWDGTLLVSDALFAGREWRIPPADLPVSGRLRIEVLSLHDRAAVHLEAPLRAGVAIVNAAHVVAPG